jgi:hypothetical protein
MEPDYKGKNLADILTVGAMALVLIAMVAALIGDWKNDIEQKSVQEAMEIANIVEYEPLPEIIIEDPILPRALPPLIEGGEVYFEEL